jgi:hypothetical protein
MQGVKHVHRMKYTRFEINAEAGLYDSMGFNGKKTKSDSFRYSTV